jgi:hypothetical protein
LHFCDYLIFEEYCQNKKQKKKRKFPLSKDDLYQVLLKLTAGSGEVSKRAETFFKRSIMFF